MKKVFVAIPISEKLQDAILKWEMDFSNLPVRWLAGKDLHITLISPWQESEENLTSVKKKLEVVKGFRPFDIVFKRVNYGPSQFKLNLIWAENKPTRQILDLKDKLYQILGIPNTYTRWTMHVTLARFKPETFSSFPIKKLDEIVWWPEKVKSIVIMESYPLSQYNVLQRIQF